MLPYLALKQSDPEWFELIHCVGGSPSLAELHQQRVRISAWFLISVNTKEQKLAFNIDIQYERVKQRGWTTYNITISDRAVCAFQFLGNMKRCVIFVLISSTGERRSGSENS